MALEADLKEEYPLSLCIMSFSVDVFPMDSIRNLLVLHMEDARKFPENRVILTFGMKKSCEISGKMVGLSHEIVCVQVFVSKTDGSFIEQQNIVYITIADIVSLEIHKV